MRGIELTPVEELSGGSLAVQSCDFDWSEGYPEDWEFVEVPTCGSCGTDERVNYVDGEWRCYGRGADHEWGAEIDMHESADGPTMNYYYPLDDYVIRMNDGMHEAAAKLKGLPLCIVQFHEIRQDFALALTGGGMDLSWEICEAFMRLGELPPTHFADLPGFAGKPSDETDRWVVAGCIRSLERAAERAASDAERGCERMRGWLAAAVA